MDAITTAFLDELRKIGAGMVKQVPTNISEIGPPKKFKKRKARKKLERRLGFDEPGTPPKYEQYFGGDENWVERLTSNIRAALGKD